LLGRPAGADELALREKPGEAIIPHASILAVRWRADGSRLATSLAGQAEKQKTFTAKAQRMQNHAKKSGWLVVRHDPCPWRLSRLCGESGGRLR
jgi:hypothetical protein